MFMSASTGDLCFARLAALETIASYGARTQADLLNIARIIAFSLVVMDSLWLSMADDVSLTMKLRLRCSAAGCTGPPSKFSARATGFGTTARDRSRASTRR